MFYRAHIVCTILIKRKGYFRKGKGYALHWQHCFSKSQNTLVTTEVIVAACVTSLASGITCKTYCGCKIMGTFYFETNKMRFSSFMWSESLLDPFAALGTGHCNCLGTVNFLLPAPQCTKHCEKGREILPPSVPSLPDVSSLLPKGPCAATIGHRK